MIEAKIERFIRNAWYVVAWSQDVGADSLFARIVLNEPLLVYRKTDGSVVVMQDRCCHRAAPLSIGRKEGDCVRCMYHGLKFDPTGRCVEVPGQDRVPPTMCVKSYPAVEQDSLIWVWMGDADKADASQIASFWWLNHPEWRYVPDTLHYQAHYQLIADNLLDFSHLTFVHPTTLGTPNTAQTRAKIEPIEGGVRITRSYANDEMQPNQVQFASFSNPVDRIQVYDWLVPSMMRMHTVVAPPNTGLFEGTIAANALEFRHTSIQTPETQTTTHYFFSQAHNFGLDVEGLSAKVHAGVKKAFIEDQVMIEHQQRILSMGDPKKPFEDVAIAHDAALMQARRLILARLEAEAAGARA